MFNVLSLSHIASGMHHYIHEKVYYIKIYVYWIFIRLLSSGTTVYMRSECCDHMNNRY